AGPIAVYDAPLGIRGGNEVGRIFDNGRQAGPFFLQTLLLRDVHRDGGIALDVSVRSPVGYRRLQRGQTLSLTPVSFEKVCTPTVPHALLRHPANHSHPRRGHPPVPQLLVLRDAHETPPG